MQNPSRVYIIRAATKGRDKEGIFNRSRCWTAAKNVSARIWWKSQFDCALSQLAQKVLSVIPYIRIGRKELFDFWIIHSKSRNRLKNSRVEELVFLCANVAVEWLGRNEVDFLEEPDSGWFNEEEEMELDEGEQDVEPVDELLV
ncbi:hypothetical protein V1507DRAFT_476412 [Lipomyces tetrasporus]